MYSEIQIFQTTWGYGNWLEKSMVNSPYFFAKGGKKFARVQKIWIPLYIFTCMSQTSQLTSMSQLLCKKELLADLHCTPLIKVYQL